MGSRVIRVFIPFFLVAYFFGGAAAIRTDRLFPLDAWTLYVKMPNNIHTYTLRLHLVDDSGNRTSILLEDYDNYWFNPDDSIFAIVWNLGKAVTLNDQERVASLVRSLNTHPILEGITHYELVDLYYRPLQRWYEGTYEEVSIQHFYRDDVEAK